MRKGNARLNRLRNLIKLHGFRMHGLRDTTKNAIAVLEKNGVDYKGQLATEKDCPQCGEKFASSVLTHKQGRDKKYCSDKCRKMFYGQKRFLSEKQKCEECGVDFLTSNTQGTPRKHCSDNCKREARKKYLQSDHYKRLLEINLEKAKAKNREKTKLKIRICKKCGGEHRRLYSWYCSDDCRREFKIAQKKAYHQMPHVIERRKAAEKADHRKERRNATMRLHLKKRRQSDPMYVAKERIRNRTKAAFLGQGFTKGCKTREMLGCTWEQFKMHIEKQFTKGMKWSNRELWHIDHIVPLASANTIEDLERLSHFSNLRPLWAGENIEKGDKIHDCQPELLIKL